MDRIGDHLIEGAFDGASTTDRWRGTAPDGTPVVIRVLGTRDDEAASTAFAAIEARSTLIASLDGDGVLVTPTPILSADDEPLAVAMPWYATSLADLLGEETASGDAPLLPLARVEAILDAALDALALLHGAGAHHGALGPDVLRFDADGRLRIVDEDARADAGARWASTAAACTAPEIAEGGAPTSASADTYGLGVIAYRMFAGRLPTSADADPNLMIDRILAGGEAAAEFSDPAVFRPELPAGIGAWLRRAIAPVDARFADAGEMRAARPSTTDAASSDEPATNDANLLDELRANAAPGTRQRATLDALAESMERDGAPPALDAGTRGALRDAARSAGLDSTDLEAMLLGPYRPRRARPAARPEAPAEPDIESVLADADDARDALVAEAGLAADAELAARDASAQPRRPVLALGAVATTLVVLAILVAFGGDEASEGPDTNTARTPANEVQSGLPVSGLSESGDSASGLASSDEQATVPAGSEPSTETGARFSDSLASGGQGPTLIVIPAGEFRMGCVSGILCEADEQPVRTVTIARPFAIGVYEVTFELFDRYVAATGGVRPGDERWGRGRHPAINVNWDEAHAFTAWLSAETGARYRLPTEAEWEYVARAGTETPWFPGSDPTALCRFGNGADQTSGEARANTACSDGVGRRSAVVGRYAANNFGVHDTLGNLWEWVEDCYVADYAGAPSDASKARVSADCPTRSLRGGGMNTGPDGLRSANRERNAPTLSLHYIGFRVLREL